MAQRQYVQQEWRLLSWWLATFHPNAEISMNVRVGPNLMADTSQPSSDADAAIARVRNRWADAVLYENNELTLVEAKIDPDPGIYSQLIHYARLLRADPGYAPLKLVPLQLIALVYNNDPLVADEASWYGVKWIVYQPNLAELPPAFQAAAVPEGVVGPVELPPNFAARLRSWGVQALRG